MRQTRRRFVKAALAAGSLAVFAAGYAPTAGKVLHPDFKEVLPDELENQPGVSVVHSVCLACNSRCGIRARVVDGRVVKIDGNPYHPANTLEEPLPYDAPLSESFTRRASLCFKGQAAIQTLYDPYRIVLPLKRNGPRGSRRFRPISWEQLVSEVSNGGKIFSDVGEDRVVKGFKDVRSSDPIDPSAPELGPKSNQLVWMTGRGQDGRVDFIKRFLTAGMGSVNYHAHGDICELNYFQSHYLLTGGATKDMKPDLKNTLFAIFVGCDPYSSYLPGLNLAGSLMATRSSEGSLKYVVVNPKMPNAATHASKWVYIRPGTDGALAMAMIRWVIENNRYDAKFLSNTTLSAAKKDGETVATNSTYLVVWEPSHPRYRMFLRAGDIGLGGDSDKDKYVVIASNGQPAVYDAVDEGSLFFEGDVPDARSGGSLHVKTALQLLKDNAFSKTLEEWGEISGVDATTVSELAREFTSYGKRAAVTYYRGMDSTAGSYAALALDLLNVLIGNINWAGGLMKGGGSYPWLTGLYNLSTFDGALTARGVKISREGFDYSKSTEYGKKVASGQNPFPAKRPWFPLAADTLWDETLAGIDSKYPYPCAILVTYFADPLYSIPGGSTYASTLKDTDKVPLFISIDITINETNVYADYIVPDVTFLEGHYSVIAPQPLVPTKVSGIRVPVVEPLVRKTADGRPMCLETFLIDVARACGVPGFGAGAIAGADGTKYDLNRMEDYYLRGFANLAFNANVPDASDAEVAYVESHHYVARFKELLRPAEWRKVVTLLSRGGAFEDVKKGYDRFYVRDKMTATLQVWNEKMATTRNSISGEFFDGTGRYEPVRNMKGEQIDAKDQGYDFKLLSYKLPIHTQSRTINNGWALELQPQNYVEVSEADAKALSISDGDLVVVSSSSNPKGIEGVAKVVKGLIPGAVAISNHYGHWEWGSRSLEIVDAPSALLGGGSVAVGDMLIGDPARGNGTAPNPVMRKDDSIGLTALHDPISGCASFSDTKVRIQKKLS